MKEPTFRLFASAVTQGLPPKDSFIGQINVDGERQEVQIKFQHRTEKRVQNMHGSHYEYGAWEDLPLVVGMSLR